VLKVLGLKNLYVVEIEHCIYKKRHLALGATQASKYNIRFCFERVEWFFAGYLYLY